MMLGGGVGVFFSPRGPQVIRSKTVYAYIFFPLTDYIRQWIYSYHIYRYNLIKVKKKEKILHLDRIMKYSYTKINVSFA